MEGKLPKKTGENAKAKKYRTRMIHKAFRRSESENYAGKGEEKVPKNFRENWRKRAQRRIAEKTGSQRKAESERSGQKNESNGQYFICRGE